MEYPELTQEHLDSLIDYRGGKLYHKMSTREAGWLTDEGYYKCSIYGKEYYLHRVIFFLFHGYWPNICDHINRNKSDNRIENLRDITFRENILNQKVNITSKSGVKNISWHKASNRWRVQVCRNYKVIDIGYFKCLGEAIRARIEFKEC